MPAVANIRSWLAVALRKDGALLGTIAVSRHEVRPFSEKEIALLQNFAAQAVIAMENARLITETREALKHQTATAEVLQVINSSTSHLAPVFDAMLGKATELCEAAFGVLRTWDGERFHFAAAFGNSQLTEWARKRPPFTPERASILGRIVGGESLVTMVDALRDQTSPGFREMTEVSGMRSGVTVALRKDAVLVGSLTVYRQEVRPFTDKQIALLQNFAAQAVIAMENARLITETREALEQQTATAEVLQVINASPGHLAPVFDAMLEKVMRLCEGTCGHLYVYDGERFHQAAIDAVPLVKDWWRQFGPVQVKTYDTPLGRLVAGERVIRIVDAREDPATAAVPASGSWSMSAASAAASSSPSMRTTLCAVL